MGADAAVGAVRSGGRGHAPVTGAAVGAQTRVVVLADAAWKGDQDKDKDITYRVRSPKNETI